MNDAERGNAEADDPEISGEVANEEQIEDKYKRLHEKMDKTARTRFIAARRCEYHDWCSTYAVVFVSCSVIGLSLFDSLEMLKPEAAKLNSFFQIFAAVGVLVYSVILAKSDFALHAYRHHQCGLKINHLRNLVFKQIASASKVDQFSKLSEAYNQCLEQHDNHINIDYEWMLATNPHLRPKWNWCQQAWHQTGVRVKWCFVYWHYFVFSFASVIGLVWMYVAYVLGD